MTGALVVLLAGALLAACGIGPGKVIADGPAEKNGPGRTAGITGPHKRADLEITDAVKLVEAFLQASAAAPASREGLMRTYISGADWKPGTDLKVVHILNVRPINDGDSKIVNLDVQHVGVLDDSGRMVPSAEGNKTYSFPVISTGGTLMLRDPPKELLLSDAGLESYFEARPLYFYSGGLLVPDLRYVSQSLTEEQKSNQLVDWLYDGPSPWLQPSVKKPPAETRPGVTKIVRGDDGSLVIDLQASLGDAEFRQLALQLARTLVRPPFTSLTIKVQGQLKSANVSAIITSPRSTPARYVVVDGIARRVKTPGHNSTDLPIPADINKNVVAVAFASDEQAVAVVQQDGPYQRLLVGSRGLAPVNLPHVSHIGQPIWLDHDARTLLVQADDHIYQVGADGKVVQDTEVLGLQGMAGVVDGRRLALVIDGGLYMVSRSENGAIAVGAKQRVPTLFDAVQGVAFADRYQVIVSGSTAAGVRLLRMNLDGTQQRLLDDIWQGTVSHIVADPEVGTALFEVQGRGAFEVSQSNPRSLYDSIDWRQASPPAADSKTRISAPSFEG